MATKPVSPWFFPAVDGMRGLAILSVLLYHSNWSARGLFGVDVFFVVSGFLISLLLLRELGSTGRINLKKFYVRRTKRLMPGLLITLGLVLLVAWKFGTLQQLQAIATKSLFSLLQIANWQQVTSGDAYWEQTGQIQPLAHMWSLSITEQFYLVWPILLIVIWTVCRKRPLAVVIGLVLLTVASALVAPIMFDGTNTDRLYLGTETRAVGFIAGATLAAIVYWLVSRRLNRDTTPQPSTRWQRISMTTLSTLCLTAVITASVMTTSYHEPWLYRGGIAGVAVAAAIFTATLCSRHNLLVRFFAFSPFIAFGKVSYTVYLLHLPIFWVLQMITPGIEPLTLFFVGGGLTWLGAAFLHYAITERMRLARWKLSRGIPAFIATTAVVAAMGIYFPAARVADAQSTTFQADAGDLHLSPGAAGGRPTVLTLGDSLANDFATMLTDNGSGAFAVIDGGRGGCGILSNEKVRATSGYTWNTHACPDWQRTWPAAITKAQPDFILIHNSWDASDQLVDGAWLKPGQPAYTKLLTERLDQVIAQATELAPHAQILLANDRPTNGIITDPVQMLAFNALIEKIASTHEHTRVLEWQEALCGDGQCRTADTAGDALFQPDNVHLAAGGLRAMAPWLEQQLAAAQLNPGPPTEPEA